MRLFWLGLRGSQAGRNVGWGVIVRLLSRTLGCQLKAMPSRTVAVLLRVVALTTGREPGNRELASGTIVPPSWAWPLTISWSLA